MKILEYQKTKLVLIVLLAALLSDTIFAQTTLHGLAEDVKSGIKKNAILSLAKGIESDNEGLKVSCIYLAGLYEIDEAVKPLIEQLKTVEDPNVKILIALALYKIGNKEGLKAVERLTKNDESPKVKKVATVILNQFK
jgi:HEAT repeat protein